MPDQTLTETESLDFLMNAFIACEPDPEWMLLIHIHDNEIFGGMRYVYAVLVLKENYTLSVFDVNDMSIHADITNIHDINLKDKSKCSIEEWVSFKGKLNDSPCSETQCYIQFIKAKTVLADDLKIMLKEINKETTN